MEAVARQNSVIATHRCGINPKDSPNVGLHLLSAGARDGRGVTAMEYGVIAAGIVIAVAAAAASLGSNVSALFTTIGGSL
jgi:pilus assembly protein Flp/PilA